MKDRKRLSNETYFFLYLLENYAAYKKKDTASVLRFFDDSRLTGYINKLYPMYHTERIENAFEDIDRKIEEINKNNSLNDTDKKH
ncbi:MAG: DUF3791 domain-containing protein [Bacteroidales bacterium]|jgi:hypothetical protein|nr:DUF3791 domain-containing protein [Bacteroidales bacterium]